MYNVFLNYSQMKRYLSVLTDSNLLSYDLVSQTFKTTEKGLRFLDSYNLIGDVLNVQFQLSKV